MIYMKKLIYASTLFALALLSGCTNQEDIISNDSDTFVLKVKVENTTGSRTTIDENNQVLWSEGDQIGVFVEGNSTPIPFTYSGMTGETANFTGDMPEGKLVAAYYPYNENTKLEGTVLSAELPSEYEYSENRTNGPMLGQPDGENGLYFKHLCGMLKLTIGDIPTGAAKLRVTNRNDYPLYGTYRVEDITVQDPILTTNNSYNRQSIIYHFTPDQATQQKTFYVPIIPSTYSLEIALLDENDNRLWYKMGVPTVKRATIVELPFIDTTRPTVVVTSHENQYSFTGCMTYTTLDIAGVIKNFYSVDDVSFDLKTTLNERHENYYIYGGAKYPYGKEKAFTHTLDVYPGENVYTISWKGKGTDDQYVEEKSTFIVNYEEIPVIADAVDMGLSVKWASHNIGATKESDYGGLYIWGDKTGTDLRKEDEVYADFMNNKVDLISGNPTYDIAVNKWGDQWRLPTEKEFDELLDAEFITQAVEVVDGVTGIRFTNTNNGNSIFLPAAGYNYGYHDLRERETLGRYWTGSEHYDFFGHMDSNIFGLNFNINKETNEIIRIGTGSIYYTFGLSVRPVYGPLTTE